MDVGGIESDGVVDGALEQALSPSVTRQPAIRQKAVGIRFSSRKNISRQNESSDQSREQATQPAHSDMTRLNQDLDCWHSAENRHKKIQYA
ncbi:hypothetical protein VH98_04370 [Acinetobacter brisouii]|nr:hypothetical protein VH98_04370 [Acinetobacter brisouii]